MSGRGLLAGACAFALAVTPPALGAAPPRRQLRVCADPNNLPFSNEQGAGFENELAQLVAKELDADVAYTWAPQRRGFVRTTLKAKRCDVVMGMPTVVDMVTTTKPYYRSTYVFVMAPGVAPIRSLDAPELRTMKIGVPYVGDDGANPPPALALASRDLVSNMRGYSVFGDYREDSPPGDLVRALRRHEVDVALVWGPLAGYYGARPEPKLTMVPIPETEAPPGMTFSFDIGIGVRKADKALAAELDAVLVRRRVVVKALLDRYGVP